MSSNKMEKKIIVLKLCFILMIYLKFNKLSIYSHVNIVFLNVLYLTNEVCDPLSFVWFQESIIFAHNW